MGEAKRRKAEDPSYGKPKRGLVVSAPMEIEGTQLHLQSTSLDPQELRFSLLFWDRLLWPLSRAIYIPSGPDEQFLETAGVLTRPEYTAVGDIAQGMAHCQITAFLEAEKHEPGIWALAQGENSFLLKNEILREGNGAFVELFRAIPVPDKTVPLNEILEFKHRRFDELNLLRQQLDGLVFEINNSEDKRAKLVEQANLVYTACADAIRVGKEWRFPIRLANLKVSLDLRPFTSGAAVIAAWEYAKVFDMALPACVLAGAAASIKIGGDFGLQKIRPRQGPYRYVYRFHNELF